MRASFDSAGCDLISSCGCL